MYLPHWFDIISVEHWAKELASGLSDSEAVRLKLNTHRGKSSGSDSLINRLEISRKSKKKTQRKNKESPFLSCRVMTHAQGYKMEYCYMGVDFGGI